MAPRQLLSHQSDLVISSKWLPKIFIQMFKEYLRAKLQAPVLPETKIAEFTNSADLDEMAHNEPPHQDLHCLPSSL